MNKMADVAKLLGVELGEKFEIDGLIGNPYFITEEGLMNDFGEERPQILTMLLTSQKKIKVKTAKEQLIDDINFILEETCNEDCLACIVKTDDYCNLHFKTLQKLLKILEGE